MLLALDTSTRLSGIALYSGELGLVSECCWQSMNQHTTELMPSVARMLAQAGVTAVSLEAVAVALGPGSFTGVRVALAAAKGLALARGWALLGVPTLDVVAYPHRYQSLPVVAVVPAGRGRVCWAVYAQGPGGWGATTAVALAPATALAATVEVPALFAGELSATDRADLAARLGSRAHILSPALALRRPGHLAEIAWARYLAGQRDDPASLTPIYMREPAS